MPNASFRRSDLPGPEIGLSDENVFLSDFIGIAFSERFILKAVFMPVFVLRLAYGMVFVGFYVGCHLDL